MHFFKNCSKFDSNGNDRKGAAEEKSSDLENMERETTQNEGQIERGK